MNVHGMQHSWAIHAPSPIVPAFNARSELMSVFKRIVFLPLACLVLAVSSVAPATALDPNLRDHDAARQATKNGEIRSLGEIRSRVGARVRGEFIGSDLNMQSRRYRLRYLRDGSVVEVDVDARTGNILGIQGN